MYVCIHICDDAFYFNNDYDSSEGDWKNTRKFPCEDRNFLANLLEPTPIWQEESEKVHAVITQNMGS